MELLGFEISKKNKKQQKQSASSIVTPMADDGSTVVSAQTSGYYGVVLDLEGIVKNESDLIRRYREIAQYGDVDMAIEDIVNESIITENNEPAVKINLDKTGLSDNIKKKIQEEFKNILRTLKFDQRGHDIFRQWYIDGRLYYHILVDDEQLKKGILELRFIDPRKIRRIKQVYKEKNERGVEVVKEVREYYIYNDKGITESTTQGIQLSLDSVIYAPSGVQDYNTGMVLSYLHKAIKPTNQLKMIEDAVVIYRISRAPERRVFYVDVGNLPKLKAEQYVNDIMNKFRNKVVYDAVTGEVRDNKKHLCLDMETKIPLLDGRTLSITEIAKEFEEGKQLWAYSADPVTGKFQPGMITWAGVTRKNADVVRITLDNGKTITCTPDHKFPTWNKGFVQAKDLVVGESMIPHYTREQKIGKKTTRYQQLFMNDEKRWGFTHRLVSKWKDEKGLDNEFLYNPEFKDEKKLTVHHNNINRFNNTPENLVRMNCKDHIQWHSVYRVTDKVTFNLEEHEKIRAERAENSRKALAIGRKNFQELNQDPEYNKKFRQAHVEAWTDEEKVKASKRAKKNGLSAQGNAKKVELYKTEEYLQKHLDKYQTEYTQEMLDLLYEGARQKFTTAQVIQKIEAEADLNAWKELNSSKVGTQKDWGKLNKGDVLRMSQNLGFNSYVNVKEAAVHRNHKIAKIEFLDDKMDTGCITVDGDEVYHGYHTFALDAGIYTKNSAMEDFWMPRREGGKGTEITTLPSGQNLSDVEDIVYFQKKLFQALNVPISRLEQSSGFSLGRSSEITRDEIKFNKFINKIRSKFSNLFISILRVQLVLKGIVREEEWDEISQDVRFDFTEDNHFSEMKNAEILQNRIAILNDLVPYIGEFYSKKWVRKNVLMQTDADIEEIDKENKTEEPLRIAGSEEPAVTNSNEGDSNE